MKKKNATMPDATANPKYVARLCEDSARLAKMPTVTGIAIDVNTTGPAEGWGGASGYTGDPCVDWYSSDPRHTVASTNTMTPAINPATSIPNMTNKTYVSRVMQSAKMDQIYSDEAATSGTKSHPSPRLIKNKFQIPIGCSDNTEPFMSRTRLV